MSASGAQVAAECIEKFNELKLNKKLKFVIYKMSDDFKQIEVEEASNDPDWDVFREKLINAQTKLKNGEFGKGPRFAVYDFQYKLQSGEGIRNKIVFLAWSPDDAKIQSKMIYASSKDALRRSLTGVATELQLNDEDDIEYQSIINILSKGSA